MFMPEKKIFIKNNVIFITKLAQQLKKIEFFRTIFYKIIKLRALYCRQWAWLLDILDRADCIIK
ncbi:UNVERIFIED_CONTAM: hypothetical protein NCL1_09543 [Trichonephila clavipes]